MYSLGTGYELRHSYENNVIFNNWRQSRQPEYAKNEEWFAFFDYRWLYSWKQSNRQALLLKRKICSFLHLPSTLPPLIQQWWLYCMSFYSRWTTTMDKPIHEREHNDCQQLITKSHGRSWLDSNIQPQRLPCVKRKTCQCSENRCFCCVIDHKYQALCCVAWCTVLFRS